MLTGCFLFPGNQTEGGVVISWDVENQASVEHWYNQRAYLAELDVPFTLYVRTGEIQATGFAMLQELQQDGHEIGFHSCYHQSALNYIFADDHTIDEYLAAEILPGLDILAGYGLRPKNFAFPTAHHFTALDNRLLEHFDSLRSVTEVSDWSFYRYNDKKVVAAYWIDYLELYPEEYQMKDIFAGMRKAKRNGWVLNLQGHLISDEDKFLHTSFDKLEEIVAYARELGLQFFKMEDLFSK